MKPVSKHLFPLPVWFLGGIALCWIGTYGKPAPEDILTWFEDEPVYREEFDLHRPDIESKVFIYFKATHGVALRGDLWDEAISGQVPREMLEAQLLESVLRARALQALAEEHGVGEGLPFPDFSAFCRSVNQSRRAALEAGRVLYGPIEFSPINLYRYHMDQLRLFLLRVMGKSLDGNSPADDLLDQAIDSRVAPLLGSSLTEG